MDSGGGSAEALGRGVQDPQPSRGLEEGQHKNLVWQLGSGEGATSSACGCVQGWGAEAENLPRGARKKKDPSDASCQHLSAACWPASSPSHTYTCALHAKLENFPRKPVAHSSPARLASQPFETPLPPLSPPWRCQKAAEPAALTATSRAAKPARTTTPMGQEGACTVRRRERPETTRARAKREARGPTLGSGLGTGECSWAVGRSSHPRLRMQSSSPGQEESN